MLIDWLTVFAQIINFMILVALLKRFLYRPILRAIKRRERHINQQMQLAQEQQAIAQAEAERYRHLQAELELQRDHLHSQAEADAEQYRQTLRVQAKQASHQEEQKWAQAWQREQQSFLKRLRQQASYHLSKTLRMVLQDLAQTSLETQMVEVFLEHLQQLDPSEQEKLHRALTTANPALLTIYSSFPLSEAQRDRIRDTLNRQTQTFKAQGGQIKFLQQHQLISGIELNLPGYKLSWTLDYYLAAFEDTMQQILAREAAVTEQHDG